jgi:hypothetical protein
LENFRTWLNQGAPSADVGDGNQESSYSNIRETK